MAIHVRETNVHWNYFLALESDVVRLSRFIEFREDNFPTYSIELARLLMSASAEIDVIAKLVCKQLSPSSNPRNIVHYASILLPAQPKIDELTVLVPRFGLTLKPWSTWTADTPPQWWSACNGVKHQRDTRFRDASLGNALNAVAALFSLTLYHYGLRHQDRNSTLLIDGVDRIPLRAESPFATDHGRRGLIARLKPGAEIFRLRSVLGDTSETLQSSQ